MKVFKFGGASVKDAPAIENLHNILRLFPDEKIVIVISAMGKTTNFLEKVLDAYYNHKEQLPELVDQLQQQHEKVAVELVADPGSIIDQLRTLFQQLRDTLQTPFQTYDQDYDKIVSFGELLSTTLISSYLNLQNISNTWLDARQLIKTDNTYREGRVDWTLSAQKIQEAYNAHIDKAPILLTQGFIGGSKEGNPVTLGREGSDYSAAIIAYSLNAESVTIWKDVPGLLNADPKKFPDAVKLDSIPYEEAIELSFYGASIIHPKTLKPLQNKHIPLYVKSFFKPENEGSVINDSPLKKKIPSYIIKENQRIITLFPRDFSFIAVDSLSEIFDVLSRHRVKINMMQNSALSFSICTDNDEVRLKPCIAELNKNFKVKYNEGIELITIRHYTPISIASTLQHREVILQQTSRTTTQYAVK